MSESRTESRSYHIRQESRHTESALVWTRLLFHLHWIDRVCSPRWEHNHRVALKLHGLVDLVEVQVSTSESTRLLTEPKQNSGRSRIPVRSVVVRVLVVRKQPPAVSSLEYRPVCEAHLREVFSDPSEELLPSCVDGRLVKASVDISKKDALVLLYGLVIFCGSSRVFRILKKMRLRQKLQLVPNAIQLCFSEEVSNDQWFVVSTHVLTNFLSSVCSSMYWSKSDVRQ